MTDELLHVLCTSLKLFCLLGRLTPVILTEIRAACSTPMQAALPHFPGSTYVEVIGH